MHKKEKVTKSDISDYDISNFTSGKDELNFAEFPLSLTSNKRPNQKTIEFQDTVYDKFKNEIIPRKLIITGSDKYGLPTSKDAEIIAGLIQLSVIQGFSSRKITFSRYQLINLFGWKHTGYYYKRITESLNRWVGVTLYYKNAWKDPETQKWMPKKVFGIIDNVDFYDPKDSDSPELCFANWNEVVFDSMRKGNLKNLNFNLYKSIPTPTSKRMFLFLDKRFHMRRKQEFDLHNFAENKVGIPNKYTTAQIKREINKASKELEKVGFLLPYEQKERYKKIGKGKWKVFFEKGNSFKSTNQEKKINIDASRLSTEQNEKKKKMKEENLFDHLESNQTKTHLDNISENQQSIYRKLLSRKVSKKKASELVVEYEEEFLEEKIEILDKIKHKRFNIGNQAGYLIKSIEENWQTPDNIKTQREKESEFFEFKEKAKKKEDNKKARERKEQELREADHRFREECIDRVNKYLSEMPVGEGDKKIKKLVAESSSMKRGFINEYLSEIEEGENKNSTDKNSFGRACYEGLLLDNFLHLIDEEAAKIRKAKKEEKMKII